MSRFQLQRGQLIYTNPQARVSVFKGRILPQSLPVAIKEEVHDSVSRANASLREAMAMSSLSHENICRIYDCFLEVEQEGSVRSVLVVELMESDLANETTARRSEGRPWTDSELYYILRSLVSALSYAEQRDISHRDLKPQNIFYSQGVVKVGDFGASTVLKKANLMYSLQGSPLYLSPELKRGYIEMLTTGERSLQYDPIKSDVYSLGMTLLHLAILGPPNQLTNLHSLEADTQLALSGLAHLPYTQFFLSLMLAVDDDKRPTFINLSEIYSQIESQPTPQPMIVETPPSPPQAYCPPPHTQADSPRRRQRCQAPPFRYMWGRGMPYWQFRVNQTRRMVERFSHGWNRVMECSWSGY